jgi:hypothetical protein
MHGVFIFKPTMIGLLTVSALSLGCKGASSSGGNPITPDGCPVGRKAMDFLAMDTQTIFGSPANPASEVDLASVVWGQESVATGCGDVVKWEDGTPEGTSWVAAVGIKYQPGNPVFPSIPVVRFLNNKTDGVIMSQEFPVDPIPLHPGGIVTSPG